MTRLKSRIAALEHALQRAIVLMRRHGVGDDLADQLEMVLKDRTVPEHHGEEFTMTASEIDWSRFDRFSESACECICGVRFRSHAKIITTPSPNLLSRRPCPSCGGVRMVRASSDPETMTIGHSRSRSGS